MAVSLKVIQSEYLRLVTEGADSIIQGSDVGYVIENVVVNAFLDGDQYDWRKKHRVENYYHDKVGLDIARAAVKLLSTKVAATERRREAARRRYHEKKSAS